LLLLASYGVLGLIWIVVRAYRIMTRIERERYPDGPQ